MSKGCGLILAWNLMEKQTVDRCMRNASSLPVWFANQEPVLGNHTFPIPLPGAQMHPSYPLFAVATASVLPVPRWLTC